MTDSVGTHDLAGDDFTVLHIINLEMLGSAKVLENVTVLISNCNFHVNKYPFCYCFLLFFFRRCKNAALITAEQLMVSNK